VPEFLAIGINHLSGTVHITSGKTAEVVYRNIFGQQVLFDKAPRLVLTMLTQVSQVPYQVQQNKIGALYSGFTVGFQTNVTCDVEWQASKRD